MFTLATPLRFRPHRSVTTPIPLWNPYRTRLDPFKGFSKPPTTLITLEIQVFGCHARPSVRDAVAALRRAAAEACLP